MRTPPRNRSRAVRFRRTIALLCGSIAVGLLPQRGVAQTQTTTTSTGFAPGSRELFSINFAQELLGEIPKSLEVLTGTMQVVEKDGMRMLRASQRSEFLITLPNLQRLPEKFTLEIDLVTRAAAYAVRRRVYHASPGSADHRVHHSDARPDDHHHDDDWRYSHRRDRAHVRRVGWI